MGINNFISFNLFFFKKREGERKKRNKKRDKLDEIEKMLKNIYIFISSYFLNSIYILLLFNPLKFKTQNSNLIL